MPDRTERRNGKAQRPASRARISSLRLRALARALRRWWAEERRYRPERRYMRG